MPHSREVRQTSHADHDPILVAALAADDLAGADRDLALELTRTCADCALLHDDLRALARATASAPPPIAMPARDFRLTPADAARLRPGGWRRFVETLSGARSGLSGTLGVGLATLGIVGLLIGNISINLGGSAAAPQTAMPAGGAAAAPADRNLETVTNAAPSAGSGTEALGAAAGASPAPAAASSSMPTTGVSGPVAPAASQDMAVGGAVNDGSVPRSSTKTTTAESDSGGLFASLDADGDQPFRPLNLLLGGIVVVGLGLVAASLLRRRRTG